MKKILFIAAAVLTLGSVAQAQTADNCPAVHKVMVDLEKDGLMAYRGEEILGGNYDSKVKMAGFAHSSVMVDDFSTYLVAETAPTPQKATAQKTYKALVAQMTTCLKDGGFKPEDNSTDYSTETVFMDPNPTNMLVAVSMFELASQYVVSLTVRKNNMPPAPVIEP